MLEICQVCALLYDKTSVDPKERYVWKKRHVTLFKHQRVPRPFIFHSSGFLLQDWFLENKPYNEISLFIAKASTFHWVAINYIGESRSQGQTLLQLSRPPE